MTLHPHPAIGSLDVDFRPGTPADASALYALIRDHRTEGHLLPRHEDDIRARAASFVVADVGGEVRGCAELVALSPRLAEVRSLVVSPDVRRHGVATRLLAALEVRARARGFQSLLALAHDPRFFIRHDFSIVPHEWVGEKIARDCVGCALFQHCGQYAMLLPLAARRQNDAHPVRLRPAVAVA